MLNFPKILTVLIAVCNTTNAQSGIVSLPGSQTDPHGCYLDGGYQWCESTQQCQRTWELPCEVTMHSEFCETTKPQTCRMSCPEPSCTSSQCSMRIDNCCETMCVDREAPAPTPGPVPTPLACSNSCPPLPPCAMPMLGANCNALPGVSDKCG